MATIIPLMFLFLPRRYAFIIVLSGTIISLAQDFLRIFNPIFRKLIYRFWGDIYRRWEIKRLGGATYILFASVISIFLFEEHIAALVMIYIIYGDTAAAFAGKFWGNHIIYKIRNVDGTFRKKTIEGTVAFFIGAFVAGMFVPDISFIWKLAGATLACLVEVASFFIDDNLTVPIVVGLIIQFAIYGELAMTL